jgi:hypothetical protein
MMGLGQDYHGLLKFKSRLSEDKHDFHRQKQSTILNIIPILTVNVSGGTFLSITMDTAVSSPFPANMVNAAF